MQNDWAQVCLEDPGKDGNVCFDCLVRRMHDVWMGERTYKDAIRAGDLSVQGDIALIRNAQSLLTPGTHVNAKRAPLPSA